MGKKCSGCVHFTKINFHDGRGGFCEIRDSRTNESGGKKRGDPTRCELYSAIPYDRGKLRKLDVY